MRKLTKTAMLLESHEVLNEDFQCRLCYKPLKAFLLSEKVPVTYCKDCKDLATVAIINYAPTNR